MKKINWRKLLVPLAVLYMVIWVGFCGWAASNNKHNYWMVEREMHPGTSALPRLDNDDWCAILASPSFASKSKGERDALVEWKFRDMKGVAEEIGYDSQTIHSWLQRTATNFESYPVETFVFTQGVEDHYRDLRNTGFPKPNIWRVFLRQLFSKTSMGFALAALPFIGIPLLVVAGVVLALFSKTLAKRWKAVVVSLIAVAFFEAWLIRLVYKRPVSLGTFSFYDNGSYVTAEGTWTSDTDVADPLQISKLDCWQNWGYCIEANARVSNGYLRVYTDYWEVADWGQDVLTIKDRESALCVNESLRIDRKNKVATFTRATKQPKPDSCADISDEPIVMHLADGIRVQFKRR